MMTLALASRKKKLVPSKLSITSDDSKILGRTTEKRREKAAPPPQYESRNFRTCKSRWTPIVHKPSNSQIFTDRRDLVSHWFDLWTDSQRKRFFDVIFPQCTRGQYKFVQDWFQERVPFQHLDFTSVLPRFLSLYVLSFLEPKSLCRASQVCWHWKFLTEQDVIWHQKCMKYGWFLPYTPPDNEYGAWKRHYISCVLTLDYNVIGNSRNDLYGTRSDGGELMRTVQKWERKQPMDAASSQLMRQSRPPWQGPDVKPRDLDKSHRAFLQENNPNDPYMPKSALMFHDKFGVRKRQSDLQVTQSLDSAILGLDSHRRKERHRTLISGEDHDLSRRSQRMNLSESIELENLKERRVRELVDQPWDPRTPRGTTRRPGVGSGGGYPVSCKSQEKTLYTNFQTNPNPRVVFISSRVPAADLLVDAVMFGVIPIVYEYEGTTTETLVMQLERILAGRHAQSLGLFCHCEEPGELRLVHGCAVNIDTLDLPLVREFFELTTNHILPPAMDGQFDIFAPLGASESGMEMMIQLNILTGMQFSSPTGIIGNYNHVNSEWVLPYREGHPPKMYFCPSKLSVWANTADQANEALKTCKSTLSPFFQKIHKDIVAQLTGQVVFDVLGQTDIQGIHHITDTLSDGLMALGTEKNAKPLEFLGRYLLEKAGVTNLPPETTMSGTGTQKFRKSQRQFAVEESKMKVKGRRGHLDEEDGEDYEDIEEDLEEVEEEELDEDLEGEEEEIEEDLEDADKDRGTEKEGMDRRRDKKLLKSVSYASEIPDSSQRFDTFQTRRFQRLTAEQLADHPEKRTPIAQEIRTTETEFTRTLQAVKTVYYKPLRAALSSNRAITSSQNVNIIFTDLLAMLDISRGVTEDVKNRLGDWDAQNSCLGDIFVKFCTRLKVYTNMLNNYTIILDTVERSKEQSAMFRAFLRRHERIPETRMMTLQELLLVPLRHIGDLLTLLSWFELHTPVNHPDRVDLASSIKTLTDLNRYITECKQRVDRDRTMVQIQKKLLNSPSILEGNRYLIKQVDVAHLKPPAESVIPELRIYQHTEVLGLYLFNDALVLTRRTTRHFPFTRAVEYNYKFEASVGLTRLKVEDIPDTKYGKNVFKMETPKREWYCSTQTYEEKFNWISVLEQTARTSINSR